MTKICASNLSLLSCHNNLSANPDVFTFRKIQNPTTFHQLHCYQPDPIHPHLLPGLLNYPSKWSPCFGPWALEYILTAAKEILLTLNQIKSLPCSPFHSEENSKSLKCPIRPHTLWFLYLLPVCLILFCHVPCSLCSGYIGLLGVLQTCFHYYLSSFALMVHFS